MVRAVRHIASVDELESLLDSWDLSLEVGGKAVKTRSTYRESAVQLLRFLRENDRPTTIADITTNDLRLFIKHLKDSRSQATVANRYRGLQSLWKWFESEGHIRTSAFAGLEKQSVKPTPVHVLDDEDVHKLLKTCSGASFDDLRDNAILRLFIDTGLRLSEVANLRIDPSDPFAKDPDRNDVDLGGRCLWVTRKGGERGVAFMGRKTTLAIDRYLRRGRGRHPSAAERWLFLGKKGQFLGSGIRQMVKRRAQQAGICAVHPHALRHLAIHLMKSKGWSDELVMAQAGWTSTDMLLRYARSTREQRLGDKFRQESPGDKF